MKNKWKIINQKKKILKINRQIFDFISLNNKINIFIKFERIF